VIGWLYYRDWKKREPYVLEAKRKEQAEAIQAMQKVSYWVDGKARAEAKPGTATWMILWIGWKSG
jgi:hypothetical protein